MIFSEFLETRAGKCVSLLNRDKISYNVVYNIWREFLIERCMRLFVWECEEIEQKEIEQRLILNGVCGIAIYKDELTAFYGQISGVTKYYDEGTHFNVNSPIYANSLKIGDDVIIISNNSFRNSLYPLIHHYAMMLAHTDVTIENILVGMRDNGNVPIAGNEKQKTALTQYRHKLYNGNVSPILDPAFYGVKFVNTKESKNDSIMDLIEVKQNILNSFYADIGVKTSWNKRGNMISEEVAGNDTMLLLNQSDMLETRKKGCELVNKKFGVNWSVRLNPEIKRGFINASDGE